jgi:hypothetical protein
MAYGVADSIKNIHRRMMMLRRKRLGVFSLGVFAICLVASPALATAQEGSQGAGRQSANVKRDDINYDVQLYLVAASSDAGSSGSSLPQSLEGTIRQLRTSLPYTNYRLATTFLNRVKDNGSIQLRGVGSSLAPSQIGPTSPTMYDFSLTQVKTELDVENQPYIRIASFRFGLRMPIVTGTSRVEGSDIGSPVISYEPIGVTTELSVREGVPTIVGTMTTSRSNESLILVLFVKKNSGR